ncbi:signal peptidase II [Hydrogenimonas urashimensis]|uniref:signal peptidase II n=1 Tax=Hydrogenimonas urashimensis TaxID=2740515 RepID=UPI001915A313|nr:signal peptidase II [Hydrogenimonas urashimensis]
MPRSWAVFLLALAGIFLIDQSIKSIFLAGWRWESPCISLTLVFNRGVAFSMFAFLGPWLKWIQLALLAGVLGYVVRGSHLKRYSLPLGLLFGAGLSNISDRFVHGGVVDYVDWHCGFDFAVFNFADVMIDLAVLWILILNFKKK